MKKPKVNDKLWYVPNDRGRHKAEPVEVTVFKVGTKYAYLHVPYGDEKKYVSEMRCEIESGYVSKDGFSMGRVHEDREVYEAHAAAETAWAKLKDVMYRAPYNSHQIPSKEKILQAAAILGLKLPPE